MQQNWFLVFSKDLGLGNLVGIVLIFLNIQLWFFKVISKYIWACLPDNSWGIHVYLLKSSQEFPAVLDKNKAWRNGRYGFTHKAIARRTCTLGCSF